MPLRMKAENGVPRMIDWPTMRWPPGRDLARAVDHALDVVGVDRAVAAARHVVLARPLHLDRRLPADRLRGLHRLGDHVRVGRGAPSEAAAGHHDVQLDLVGRDARDLGRGRLVEVRHLVPAPDLDHVVVVPRDRVHRLHRGVGEVGELEHRLELLAAGLERLLDVAVVPRHRGIAAG